MERAERDMIVDQAREVYNAGDSAAAVRLYASVRDEFYVLEHRSTAYGHFCNNYGSALAESGDPQSARSWFRAAQQIYHDRKDLPALANIWFNLANVAKYLGDTVSAEHDYRASMNLYKALDDPDGEVKVALSLVASILDRGDAEAMRPLMARADRLVEAGHGGPAAQWSRSFAAARIALLIDADAAAAFVHLENAIGIAEEHLGPDYVSETVSYAAEVVDDQDDTEITADDLEQMEADARAAPNRLLVSTLYWLARVWSRRGAREQAERLFAECVALVNDARAFTFGAEKNNVMQELAQIVHSYCRELHRNGDVVRALDVSEDGQGRSLLDRMFRHQIVRQSGRTIRAAGDGRVFLDSAGTAEIAAACRELSLHVLKFLEVGDDLLCFVDTSGSLTSWMAPRAPEKLADFLEIVERPRLRTDLRAALTVEEADLVDVPDWESVAEVLQAVYEALLPPVVRARFEQENGRLLVIPHQLYYHLPWAFLGAGGFRIGDRWEVSLAPSMGAFLQLDHRRDPHGQDGRVRSAAVLAAHRPWSVDLSTENAPNVVRFPELHGTVEEAELVARMTGARALVGEQASVERLLREMAAVDVVHVSAHGYWAPELGGLSFVLLDGDDDDSDDDDYGDLSDVDEGVDEPAPGVLEAERIADQLTAAELVVLSGCQTGLGYPHPDSYLSVPHAFLTAGAKAVLMTLWPIGDGAAVEFFRVFYRHLTAGASSAVALATTQRELDGLLAPWDNAAFVLLGNPFTRTVHDQVAGPVFCGGDLIRAGQQGEVADLDRLRDLHQTGADAFQVSAEYDVVVLSKDAEYELWRDQDGRQTLREIAIALEKADYLDD